MTNYHACWRPAVQRAPAAPASITCAVQASAAQPGHRDGAASAVTDLQEAQTAYDVVNDGTEPWQVIVGAGVVATYDQAVDYLAQRLREASRRLASVTL